MALVDENIRKLRAKHPNLSEAQLNFRQYETIKNDFQTVAQCLRSSMITAKEDAESRWREEGGEPTSITDDRPTLLEVARRQVELQPQDLQRLRWRFAELSEMLLSQPHFARRPMIKMHILNTLRDVSRSCSHLDFSSAQMRQFQEEMLLIFAKFEKEYGIK